MEKLRVLFGSWEKTALALVAFLVVVPSVINSIRDILISVQGLPIGEKEKINAELFEKHFKESPAASEQITIEGDLGMLAMTLDVYKNGDIFVDYGRFTQWFPFEYEKQAKNSFDIISLSYAWRIKSSIGDIERRIKAETKSVTHVPVSKTKVERIRELSDGSIEKQIINRNTGEVLSVESIISSESELQTEDIKERNMIDIRSKPSP